MQTSIFRSALLCLGIVCAYAGCSATSSSTPSTAPVSGVIGAQGGTVTTSDGRVSLQIPPGALGADTKITIAPVASPPSGAAGQTFDIGPTGTQFATPAVLTFVYQTSELGGKSETDLSVMTYAGSAWTASPSSVDAAAKKVSASIPHLSLWGYGYLGTVSRYCKMMDDAACGPGCSTTCTGATPFALCVEASSTGASKMGGTSMCITQSTCTCVAKSTCTRLADVCGAGCSITCDAGPTPYAVCVDSNIMKIPPPGMGSTCVTPATCTCSDTEPMQTPIPDGGGGGK